jgi:magnesium transporter
MAPEEAADLLGGLPDEQAEQVLELMEPQEQQQVQNLLQYPEDSVGGRMRPVLAVVPQDRTAAEAIDMLRTMPPDQPLFYVYVVDEQNRLVGAVSLRGLVTSPPGTVLKDICDRDVIRVPADADQEALAAIFSKYELLAVPVVDAQGRLLGRVTVDDIFDVIEEEVTEDAYKMAGLNEEELGSWSPVRVALARLPWLLICLGGTMLTGVVAYVFRFTIKETIGIVAFIPAIGAMGGNMGLQTSTVAVRGMATGQLDRVSPLRHILKEIGSALLVALTCGSVMGVVARFWVGNPMLGVVVGVAMFAAMSTAAMLGAVLPLLLRRLSIDPAIASGPLLTTVNDSLAQFMYLGLATLLLVKHH